MSSWRPSLTFQRAHVRMEAIMGGRRRPESFWMGLVGEWRASGLPLARFARARGVAPNSLAYWVEREAPPVRLLQVAVKQSVVDVDARARVELALRGAVLRLSGEVPAAWVAELICRVGED